LSVGYTYGECIGGEDIYFNNVEWVDMVIEKDSIQLEKWLTKILKLKL
jgi:hypothetical protein